MRNVYENAPTISLFDLKVNFNENKMSPEPTCSLFGIHEFLVRGESKTLQTKFFFTTKESYLCDVLNTFR